MCRSLCQKPGEGVTGLLTLLMLGNQAIVAELGNASGRVGTSKAAVVGEDLVVIQSKGQRIRTFIKEG